MSTKPEVGDIIQSVKAGDTWEYTSGVRINILKINSKPNKESCNVKAEVYHKNDPSNKSLHNQWIISLIDAHLVSRGIRNPNIVNPLYYPDHPETKEECDRAFDILRNMCRG
jgi:hypothetical protein